jgi:glycogen debranching enzyme
VTNETNKQSIVERIEKLKPQVLDLMVKNRRTLGEYQYTVPSPETYPYQWLWDSCFHAIILTHFDVADAKKEIISLISRQFDNGMLPHMIYWVPGEQIKVAWGKEGTSSITQPPILAQAVKKIWDADQDVGFLQQVYPALYHFYNYLLTDRDPRHHHLVGIINPDESGEDNSPRFDIPLGLTPEQTLEENFQKRMELIDKNKTCNFDAPFCMRNFFWVKDVPFNALMVSNLRALADLATALDNKEDARVFHQEASDIAQAMRDRMVEDGLFWSTYGQDYKKIKVKTWAIFAPLIAGILTPEEANDLVERFLLNPQEFRSLYMIPTVSQADSSFDARGFWRGPVWIAINWLVYHALKEYGLIEPAELLREASVKLLEQSGFREQFDPLTGDGLGAEGFTWGGLIIDMN